MASISSPIRIFYYLACHLTHHLTPDLLFLLIFTSSLFLLSLKHLPSSRFHDHNHVPFRSNYLKLFQICFQNFKLFMIVAFSVTSSCSFSLFMSIISDVVLFIPILTGSKDFIQRVLQHHCLYGNMKHSVVQNRVKQKCLRHFKQGWN